jgi:surface antigen
MLAGMLAVILMGPVVAANLSFLKGSPLSYFTEEDMRLLREAAQTVLDSDSKGAAEDWHNDATGNSGRFELTDLYVSADGRHCKRVAVITRARGVEQHSSYPLCRAPDGRWSLDAEAAMRG